MPPHELLLTHDHIWNVLHRSTTQPAPSSLVCILMSLRDCWKMPQTLMPPVLLAILLFADDIALFSYSTSVLQKQLDILAEFCLARGLSVNVKKTKTLVFERRKSVTPARQKFCMRAMSLNRLMSSNTLAFSHTARKVLALHLSYSARQSSAPCLDFNAAASNSTSKTLY